MRSLFEAVPWVRRAEVRRDLHLLGARIDRRKRLSLITHRPSTSRRGALLLIHALSMHYRGMPSLAQMTPYGTVL